MYVRIIFALLIVLLSILGCGGGGGGSGTSDPCGPLRVLNGEVCVSETSPIVRINTGSGVCTATVISSDRVLTAAHCFPRRFRGAEVIASNGDTTFSDVVFFPSAWFERGSADADAAVIRIDPSFVPRNGIQPIRAFHDSDSLEEFLGSEVIVAGYGQIGSGVANGSPFPLAAFMTVTDLGEGTFTAADTSERTGNACRGDSGAPALQRGPDGEFFVVGIVSRGVLSGDCDADPFTIFGDLNSPPITLLVASETQG